MRKTVILLITILTLLSCVSYGFTPEEMMKMKSKKEQVEFRVDCQHFFVQLLFGHICKTIFYWSHVFQSTVNTFIIVP